MIYIDDKFYKNNKEVCDEYLNRTIGDILIFNTMFFNEKYTNKDMESKLNTFLMNNSATCLINKKVFEVIAEINVKLITNENLTPVEEIIKTNCDFLIQDIYDKARYNNHLKKLEILKMNIEKNNKTSNKINLVLFSISTLIALAPYKDYVIKFITNIFN